MWSRIKKWLGIGHKEQEVVAPKPVIVKPVTPPEEKPVVEAPVEPPKAGEETYEEQIARWTRVALDIVQSFEGETRWANITGNFDGAGLTCGALGWTWQYEDQQRLVKEFKKTVPDWEFVLSETMPKYGKRYMELCRMSRSDSWSEICSWSTPKGGVSAPIRKELEAFWTSEDMIEIQCLEARRTMTQYALDNIASFKGSKTFQKFLWLFDTRVLNGSLKGVGLGKYYLYDSSIVDDYLDTAEIYGGHNRADAMKNVKLWSNKKLYSHDEPQLMALAWDRAKLARREFVHTTMNRRGTISTECGMVNGKMRFPFEEAGINPREVLRNQ